MAAASAGVAHAAGWKIVVHCRSSHHLAAKMAASWQWPEALSSWLAVASWIISGNWHENCFALRRHGENQA